METDTRCPECGAIWRNGLTCQDHFHQMLSWESEYPDKTQAVHHLLVLCYHLQHPHLYSPQGLESARQLLVSFVEQSVAPGETVRRQRGIVDSGKRAWKITGTPGSFGVYAHPIHWPITAGDITAGTLDDYLSNVQDWARSALEALKASGNLAE